MSSIAVSPATNRSRDIVAGLVGGAVAAAYALSYAALLFAGPLKPMLPWGIGLALVSAALGAAWLAWRSHLSFAVGGPDASATSILAGISATMTVAAPEEALVNILVLLLLATLLCGVFFLALGAAGAGAAVRYVPYPVVAGFLASTGWLISVGALRVAGDPQPGNIVTQLLAWSGDPRVWTATIIAAGGLYVLRRVQKPAFLPAAIAVASLATLAVLAAGTGTLEQARAAGWLFEITAPPQWPGPWRLAGASPDWHWIGRHAMDLLAMAGVAVITLLLSSSGLEAISRQDVSLDRELRIHGWMNLASAAVGGYVCLVSVGRSKVLLDCEARSRAAGFIVAAVCVAAALGGTRLLEWLPRPVLAGFLLAVGLSMLAEWVFGTRKRLNTLDWLLVLAILAVTATVGFTIAVLAGILASCLSFAIGYSRIGVVQHDLDASAVQSSVQRPAAQLAVLAAHARDLRVLVLRGLIFFGTAYSVLDRLRPFIASAMPPRRRVLVIDFSHVAGLDASAAMTFEKLARLCEEGGVMLIACAVPPSAAPSLAGKMALESTLDAAMERAEAAMLLAYGASVALDTQPLESWVPQFLASESHWRVLRPLLTRREVVPGEELMRQGDASDGTLFLVESGRFEVLLESANSPGSRIAVVLPGNVLGEMALYATQQRTATVRCEAGGVVWSLNRVELEQLSVNAPDAAMAVHSAVMRAMVVRLQRANATIAALQRSA